MYQTFPPMEAQFENNFTLKLDQMLFGVFVNTAPASGGTT